MTIRDSTGSLLVDGIRVAFESAATLHGVKNPIGQMTVTFPKPLPAALTSGTGPIGKRIVLQGTQASHDGLVFTDGVASRQNLRVEAGQMFTGTIRRKAWGADPASQTETYQCSGDLRLLANKVVTDRSWNGPIVGSQLIRGLLEAKGYGTSRRPAVFLDEIRFPDGQVLSLGGNVLVDDGQVRLAAGSNELGLATNIAQVCGYALYELPTGSPRMSRVMGIPPSIGSTDLLRTDGGYRVVSATDEGFTWGGEEDGDEPINYWEVFGARWSEEDGTEVEIRSFPEQAATIVPDIPTDEGFRKDEFSSPYILTQRQADGARNIRERDTGGRVRTVEVEVDGMPTVYPGHLHRLVVPAEGIDLTFFVMTVRHQIDARGGFRTQLTYRRGSGAALPAGVDNCFFRSLFTTPRHLGDEYVDWYAVKNPTSGVESIVTFTPTTVQTSLAIVGRAHGCNSQWTVKPPPDGLTGSKVRIEQLKAGGVASDPDDWERVGENELPVLDERYPERRNYLLDSNWVELKVPISGTLAANRQARVIFAAGSDGVGRDDYEVKNVSLMNCEEGQPKLPAPPRPTPPAPAPQQPGTTAPGGGTGTQPDRPASIRLRQDGTVTVAIGFQSATRTVMLPQGTKRLRLTANFTNLAAASGSKGAGFSEYAQIHVATNGAGADIILNSRWLNNAEVVASGSGERHAIFNVEPYLTAQAGSAQRIKIFTEVNTITFTIWDALPQK